MRKLWIIAIVVFAISVSVLALVSRGGSQVLDPSSDLCHLPTAEEGNTQQIGIPVASPNVILVKQPTVVTVAVDIVNSELVPETVRVLRVDSNTKHCKLIARLNDDGTKGDVLHGDKTFTAQITLNEPMSGPVELRVAAKFKKDAGESISSPVFVVAHNPLGVGLSDLGAMSPLITEGTVSSVTSVVNSQGTDIVTNVMIENIRALKGNVTGSNIVVDVPGGTIGHIATSTLGTPTFSSGETILLLLNPAGANGHFTIKDDALGTYHIHTNASGTQVAVVDPAYRQVETIRAQAPDFQIFLTKSSE